MISMFFIIFLTIFCCAMSARLPVSPCPNIFRYERRPESSDLIFPDNNHKWKGLVTVTSPGAGQPVIVKLIFAAPSVLRSKYVGKLDLREERTKVIDGDVKILHYDVYFPKGIPLPTLLGIHLNHKIICAGPPPISKIVTRIALEHSLFPIVVNVTSRNIKPNSNDSVHRMTTNHLTDGNDNIAQKCGNNPSVNNSKNSLVVHGSIAENGAWPWLVPIFLTTSLGLKFQCSGTLVSSRHIITGLYCKSAFPFAAAHCVQPLSAQTIPADHLVVYTSKYNIRNWTDTSSEAHEVRRIHMHPDFNVDTLENDLAVLELLRHVHFDAKINVACLWTGDPHLERIVGMKGTVVGWGVNEPDGTISAFPREIRVPIVSQEECLRSKHDFIFFTSDKTLCAGNRDGTGPCNGDSGGGLYLPIPTINGIRWHLRGVVSLSLKTPQGNQCDLYNYTVFTDTAKFLPWIKNIMNT